jgi:hypothetical protein
MVKLDTRKMLGSIFKTINVAPADEGINESHVPTDSMFRGCVVPYLELSSSSHRLTV